MIRESDIRALLPNKEEYLLGFSDLKDLLQPRYAKYRYCIVIGKKLDDQVIDSIREGPNRNYYDLYTTTNQHLADLAEAITGTLQNRGISCTFIPPSLHGAELPEQYEENLTSYFSHKMAATRSGLGWIGKTALFISKQFGPRVRLVSILVDHPIESARTPIDKSRCGNCAECVEACPAQAATGALWETPVHRDSFFNPFKCLEKCKELTHQNFGMKVSICGICVSVCPIGNRSYQG